jgi:hypothetical protein
MGEARYEKKNLQNIFIDAANLPTCNVSPIFPELANKLGSTDLKRKYVQTKMEIK